MKIALVQGSPCGVDSEDRLSLLENAAQRAAHEGARLLILSDPNVLPDSRDPRVLEKISRVAQATRLYVAAAIAEVDVDHQRDSLALLTARGRLARIVRHRSLATTENTQGHGPMALTVAGIRTVVAIGCDWRSTELLRGALIDPGIVFLLVVTREDNPAILRWAREFAESDHLFVVVCNSGRAGSLAVAPGGRVIREICPDEELAVVDLSARVINPLLAMPDSVGLADLDEPTRAELREALVVLVALTDALTEALRTQRGRHEPRLVRRRIRQLWEGTVLGVLWHRLTPTDREELVAGTVADLTEVQRHVDPGGLMLAGPMRWLRKTPIVDVHDAAFAIRRTGVAAQRRRALAVGEEGLDELTARLRLKLSELREDPSSVPLLTQPYLQGMAGNFLRDVCRAGHRSRAAGQRRSGRREVVDHAAPAVGALDDLDLSELRHDLATLVDLEVLDLVLADLTPEEIADARSIPIAEAERLRNVVRQVLLQRLGDRG